MIIFQPSLSCWLSLLWPVAGFFLFASLVFVIFGSAKVQAPIRNQSTFSTHGPKMLKVKRKSLNTEMYF